jgi:selenocysteine-specific translation elongation factor
MDELIGRITHYFDKIGVAVIELSGSLKVGDTIKIKGKDTDFEQVVDSMQVDKAPVEAASAGDGVGLKVANAVNEGDEVFVVKE